VLASPRRELENCRQACLSAPKQTITPKVTSGSRHTIATEAYESYGNALVPLDRTKRAIMVRSEGERPSASTSRRCSVRASAAGGKWIDAAKVRITDAGRDALAAAQLRGQAFGEP